MVGLLREIVVERWKLRFPLAKVVQLLLQLTTYERDSFELLVSHRLQLTSVLKTFVNRLF